ncbi:diguanylate cyclase (GGDEF)-like protein [Marinomonas alcarazii]|uniref:Diguanylate cyclase (GGDEF)-like protein n=1 Tax=Marinomonas alcarazii TaxID=491949 RepID=A0A318VAT0_9GAMM|nr:GGDEF domain-containing protein [Marinomonas alcarazii]PYF81009.1 diguanylate cyclase (GGDEF)-like protein [Marinomonas alcarazii]
MNFLLDKNQIINTQSKKKFTLLQLIIFITLPICALALIGVFSRPAGSLAAIWPANAFLLGMMARYSNLRNIKGYLAAFIGYFISDLLVGTPIEKNLFLNLGNLIGTLAGLFFIKKLPSGIFPITQPFGILKLVGAALAASIGSSFVGMLAYPLLWGGKIHEGAIYWGITELANYIVFLPIVLTTPNLIFFIKKSSLPKLNLALLFHLCPALSVILLCILATVIEGPGAIAIPILGLLWCGMRYSIFHTAILTFAFCYWILIAISVGYIHIFSELSSWGNLMSLRLSISFIALIPLINVSNTQLRLRQIEELQYSSSHDSLTGTLNRGAFYKKAKEILQHKDSSVTALLMLDLDHFKSINDRYGHSAGDQVLRHFVQTIRHCIKQNDIVGRVGGEEFSIILQSQREQDLMAISQKICDTFANSPCYIDHTFYLPSTVSIGLVMVPKECNREYDKLAQQADSALYQAKTSGRNKVVVYEENIA